MRRAFRKFIRRKIEQEIEAYFKKVLKEAKEGYQAGEKFS
jgi:hypothetical protein